MSKYTAELLAPIVASQTSLHGVLRSLGLKLSGGSQAAIKRLIQRYQLDTSHFLGQGHGKGRASPNRLPWQQVLVLSDKDYRVTPSRLRRAMLESGIKDECAICSLGSEWNGVPLRLQIDHKDGNFQNNRRGNLRFLCPNCHSQTDNFGVQNAYWV